MLHDWSLERVLQVFCVQACQKEQCAWVLQGLIIAISSKPDKHADSPTLTMRSHDLQNSKDAMREIFRLPAFCNHSALHLSDLANELCHTAMQHFCMMGRCML